MQPVIGDDSHTSTIEVLGHDAWLLALLSEVRRPGTHTSISVADRDGHIERSFSTIGSTLNVYVGK